MSNNSAFFAGTQATDGWSDDTNETWTYVSATSFKISGVDLSAKYTVGTRIKLTQTTVKYFVVAAVAFSTDTTVTITAGTDYTLANAAISANFHSYAANPQGYPGWFNWAWTPTGFSAGGTVTTQFSVVGRMCTINISPSVFGTSNATTFTFSAPIACSSAGAGWIVHAVDAGADLGSPGLLSFVSSGTTATAFKTVTGNAWTASGAKGIAGVFTYPI